MTFGLLERADGTVSLIARSPLAISSHHREADGATPPRGATGALMEIIPTGSGWRRAESTGRRSLSLLRSPYLAASPYLPRCCSVRVSWVPSRKRRLRWRLPNRFRLGARFQGAIIPRPVAATTRLPGPGYSSFRSSRARSLIYVLGAFDPGTRQ